MYDPDDTIAAIASAAGGAARGIVRISGPATAEILALCISPRAVQELAAFRQPSVVESEVCLKATGCQLPASIYFWPDVRSYTRQPAAEIHTVGSRPLVGAILEAICTSGARLAQPGEFTLRAFLAGRLDLTQAEAVLGVIDAQSDSGLKVALEQLAGGLARPLQQLRDRLLDLLAHLEAGLDFVEEDIEFVSRQAVAEQLETASQQTKAVEGQLQSRRRSDELPKVVLVGSPNVGKSSLFNALTAESGALVSDEAGTTRDYVTATLELGGIRCQLTDTAGREQATDGIGISQAAQQLAAKAAANCDIELICLDNARPLNAWERDWLARPAMHLRLVVVTKSDRSPAVETLADATQSAVAIRTSVVSGEGLSELRAKLHTLLSDLEPGDRSGSLTAERCAASLQAAAEATLQARQLNAEGGGEELIAAELRLALGELGKVVGAVYTDDVLDRVFSRFCIGK